jgi:hypothetical protein
MTKKKTDCDKGRGFSLFCHTLASLAASSRALAAAARSLETSSSADDDDDIRRNSTREDAAAFERTPIIGEENAPAELVLLS